MAGSTSLLYRILCSDAGQKDYPHKLLAPPRLGRIWLLGGEPIAGMMFVAESEVCAEVARQLSPTRWQHTLAMAETARSLAARFGADQQSAMLAGLLHDSAREMAPERLVELAREYGAEIDAIEMAEPLLLHGKVSAAWAAGRFALRDADLLGAIAYHITGAPGMSLLQKVVFLADFVEPGRASAAAVEAREAAERDLTQALLTTFDAVIVHVLSDGYLLHPRTVEARNELLLGRGRSRAGS